MNLGKSQPKLPAQQSTSGAQQQNPGAQQQQNPGAQPVLHAPALNPQPVANVANLPLHQQPFANIVAAGQNRRLTDSDVLKAVVFQAANVGGGAAFAFGLGRSLGADVAEMIVRAGFGSKQLAGVGPDAVHYHETADQSAREHTAQVLATTVARAVGAVVGGGIGASVGNVVAPRMAGLAGKQFLPIPANVLVPDNVSHLQDAQGNLYGDAGRQRLRDEVTAAHRTYGAIAGDTHVHAGQVTFGVENAVRGGGQGKQPMGAPVDATVSTVVSATAGAATGAYAALAMAKHRVQVPDPTHNGNGPAPMVDVPTFYVGDAAPIPNRFTGPGTMHTIGNIAKGTGERIVQMGKATAVLSTANVLGTAIAGAIPKTPGDVAHRFIQALESGIGVAIAVPPWFSAQPTIGAHDAARIRQQQDNNNIPLV